jgi:hypothetical protein
VKAKTVRKKATLPCLVPIPVIVFPRKQAQYYNAESEELHGVSATDGLIPIEKRKFSNRLSDLEAPYRY